ncbi:unnamed protein product [Absidia cylindrospora]
MYPHLTRQNPTLTNRPLPYDSSKHHPAFGHPSQPIMPMPPNTPHHTQRRYMQQQQQQQQQHPSYNANPTSKFDASVSSPIFYGYVPVHSVHPMGPKL